jgi:hypothetical protein
VRPVLGKRIHQLAHHRPFDFEMQVTGRLAALERQTRCFPDVKAAGEADASVDDEDLPVISQIEISHVPRDHAAAELGDTHASLREHRGGARLAVGRSHAIDQHAHLNAPAGRPGEGFDETFPHSIHVEDVGDETNRSARLFDRLQHGGVGLVSVPERTDPVSGQELVLGHPVHGAGQRSQRILDRRRRGCRRESGREPVAGRDPVHAGLDFRSAAFDAVDPEDEVERRSEHGSEPREPYPPDGCAYFALVQQDVSRDDEREDHAQDRRDQGPCREKLSQGRRLRLSESPLTTAPYRTLPYGFADGRNSSAGRNRVWRNE